MGVDTMWCCHRKLGSTSSSQPSQSDSILKSDICPILVLMYISSGLHGLLGVMSIILGVLATEGAEVWMAHRVSPIWSGAFYILTAVVGIIAAKKRTAYLVMCVGALCVVSIVVGVVCIQLLKLGLITQLSDGDTYRKDALDMKVILAMATSGVEMLVCVLTFPICCKMAAKVKEEVHMKRDGTFSIQVLGDRDIVIHQTDSTSYERLFEDEPLTDLAMVTKKEQTDLLLATMGIKRNQSSKESTPKSTRKAAKGNGSTVTSGAKKAKRSESTTPLVSSKTKESMTSSMQSQCEEGITSRIMLENPEENSPVIVASAAIAVMRKSNNIKEDYMRVSEYDNLEDDNVSGKV